MSSEKRNIALLLALFASSSVSLMAQNVTFQPYIQIGDNGTLGSADSAVVSWQTDETTPNQSAYLVQWGPNTAYGNSKNPDGRVIDNYLSVDPSLPKSGQPYGAHVAYTAVLSGLSFDTTYYYKISGPGLPNGGFIASFHSRKRGDQFSFAVEGDEGFFPTIGDNKGVNYEARIIHEIFNASNLNIPGQPARPGVDFVVNTGDNVYNVGSQDNYRDYWFPVWNNDVDSNETGAPLARSIPVFIVAGNHDTGGNGDSVNLLSTGTGRYNGGLGGGNALDYFNDYYYPLNGPTGFDSQWIWNGDVATPTGWYLSYAGQNYTSPSVFEAISQSTVVDTGKGAKQQMERMANYSYDYGNAHFLFLDSNPHLFDSLVSYDSTWSSAPSAFPDYPSQLRSWIINDLDSSKQLWKFVVFHHSAFSSGNGTLRNFQMRTIVKVLEDHGVNMVFNGHEHNYQRTFPLRASDYVAAAPSKSYSTPAVWVDTAFNGTSNTVPDGIIHLVEGAGGNRDFDGNYGNPRGNGEGLDQDDSATGFFQLTQTLSAAQGPSSWLDADLTNNGMVDFFAGAGSGQTITVNFKAKVFSFADVVINGNSLTLYQITEPLQNRSSATVTHPAPYGTDMNGVPLNDPIPDTIVDLANNAAVISAPAVGTPVLLDKFTVTKPDVSSSVTVTLSAPPSAFAGGPLVYSIVLQNNGSIALNGTQVRLLFPSHVTLNDPINYSLSLQGNEAVLSLGRLAPGAKRVMQIKTRVTQGLSLGTTLATMGSVVSGTAMPLTLPAVQTTIIKNPILPVLP